MTHTHEDLRSTLHRIDGRGYKAYRDIAGRWDLPDFTLHIDHVQGDPFAAPSRVRVLVPATVAKFEPDLYSNASRATGVAWLLARRFATAARQHSDRRGTGKSGLIQIETPGQEVLQQTATMLHDNGMVEARFTVGLPARGRSVLGKQAADLLLSDLPAVVQASLFAESFELSELQRHANVNEDADALRVVIRKQRWVAFVADGSILPRRSGVDERPLESARAVPFESPDELRQSITLPHAGTVRGMAIPVGVTLIVGGGYHGKSTLLTAIERGVYNHAPDDGRELVVSDPDLVKIRAEDGRSVVGVNISPFINDLPLGQSTEKFSTENASGSTSQAAAIIEALEVGATGLLIDEDTAATNFMIRDARMQALIPKEQEPITPLIDRVRQLYTDPEKFRTTSPEAEIGQNFSGELYKERGISTILVIGGSGDYLDVADHVVAMHNFRPVEMTAAARQVAQAHPTQRVPETIAPFPQKLDRIPLAGSIDPQRGKRAVEIKVRGLQQLQFGQQDIDLSAVEQLVARGQTKAIGEAIWYACECYMDGTRTLAQVIELVYVDIARDGLDVLDSRKMGNFALPRRHELAAAINRLRMFRVG